MTKCLVCKKDYGKSHSQDLCDTCAEGLSLFDNDPMLLASALRFALDLVPDGDYRPTHVTELRRPIQTRAFLDKLIKMYYVHLDKNADYSPANILGTGPLGVIVRMWDKMARLMNLSGFRIEIAESHFAAPLEPKNESIEDAYMDLAVYGIIGLLLREGKWGK